MRFKQVVFDIGNVLFGYDPKKIIEALVPSSPFKAFYLNELFLSDRWQRLDRGDITCHEVVKELAALSDNADQVSQEVRLLIDYFVDHLDLIPEIQTLFETLSKQYPIYILSNFQDKPFDRLEILYPFLKLATGKIVSAKVGCKKPEPRIYDLLLSTFQLNPSETLFIDDLEDNIAAAEKKGIVGIPFKSPQQTITDVEKILTT